MSKNILVCALWEDHDGLVTSERRFCEKCGVAVAVDAKNIPCVASMRLEVRCLRCSMPMLTEQLRQGNVMALVGGERLTDVKDFMDAVRSQIRRRAG